MPLTYARASALVYGCGTWSSHFAISGSPFRHSTISGASLSRHARSVTIPSDIGAEPTLQYDMEGTRREARTVFSVKDAEGDVPMTTTELRGRAGLSIHGLKPTGTVIWNPTTSMLYEHAVRRGEGRLAEGGPLAVDTGRHTGRSPKDKFVVREPGSEERIWWGEINHPISEGHFEGLRAKVVAHLEQEDDLYVVDAFAGADPAHRIAVRVIPSHPYHALFARTMFIDPDEDELTGFTPQALVLHAPAVDADPEEDGVRSSTFVALHPTRGEVVIGGTY